MKKEDVEKNVLRNSVNVIMINARVMALENLVFGYLSAEQPAEQVAANRREFYRQYADNLRKLTADAFHDHYPVMERIQQEIQNALRQAADL